MFCDGATVVLCDDVDDVVLLVDDVVLLVVVEVVVDVDVARRRARQI